MTALATREDILVALQQRLETVNGGVLVLRNPKVPPKPDLYDCITIITGDDSVTEISLTGDYPVMKRQWEITVVPYITAPTSIDDEEAEALMNPYILLIKKALYDKAQPWIGLIIEKGISKPLKPYIGEPGICAPIEIEIWYEEDISDLFT